MYHSNKSQGTGAVTENDERSHPESLDQAVTSEIEGSLEMEFARKLINQEKKWGDVDRNSSVKHQQLTATSDIQEARQRLINQEQSQQCDNSQPTVSCGVENTDTGISSKQEIIDIYRLENFFQKTLFDELRLVFGRIQRRLVVAYPENKAQYRTFEADCINLSNDILGFVEADFDGGSKNLKYKASYNDLMCRIEVIDVAEKDFFDKVWKAKKVSTNLDDMDISSEVQSQCPDTSIESFLTTAKAHECKQQFDKVVLKIASKGKSFDNLSSQLSEPYYKVLDALTTSESPVLRSFIGEIYAIAKCVNNMNPSLTMIYDADGRIQSRISDLMLNISAELNAVQKPFNPSAGELALRAKSIRSVTSS